MTKYDSKESDIVIRVILIEDDENECEEYKKITEIMDDIEIVAITNSSTDALKQVKRCNHDAVILALELNKGEGSGPDDALPGIPGRGTPGDRSGRPSRLTRSARCGTMSAAGGII